MLRRRLLLVPVAVLALSAVSTAAASESSSSVTRATSLEALVLGELNAVRATHGVRPLTPSTALSRAANSHSRSMLTLGFFAHESRNGTSFDRRVRRFYAATSPRWTVGENLAMFGGITPSARSIVSSWMASPGHRANVLRASFREAGIAIVHDPSAGGVFGGESTWVVTLDLGGR
jgi:uncharacterized protein YkwD